jgi:hypothetical protein
MLPDPRQPDPQEAVGLGQANSPAASSLEDLQLVPLGENLELQRRSRAHGESHGSGYVRGNGSFGTADERRLAVPSVRPVTAVGSAACPARS